jgi:hypothetical protein
MHAWTSALVMLLLAGCASAAPAAQTAPTTTAAAATAPTTAAPTTAAPTTAAPTRAAILPDPQYTPGVTNPEVSPATIGQTVCARGWTATVRPPESYTEHVKELEAGAGGTASEGGVTYQVHGFEVADGALSHYELDHLIPLELGGAPADPRNLWLEPDEAPEGAALPGTGSQTKDKVEDAAREAVCSGRLPLADAQREMAANWLLLGRQLGITLPAAAR